MFDLDALDVLERGLTAPRAALPPRPDRGGEAEAPKVCPETAARAGKCPFFHGGTA